MYTMGLACFKAVAIPRHEATTTTTKLVVYKLYISATFLIQYEAPLKSKTTIRLLRNYVTILCTYCQGIRRKKRAPYFTFF